MNDVRSDHERIGFNLRSMARQSFSSNAMTMAFPELLRAAETDSCFQR